MDHGAWLKDVLVFLAAAGIVVPLFHRARIGAVLGFLLIGVLVGPNGLGRHAAEFPWLRYLTIENRERVETLAELGIIFLLFLIGLELSLARLWALRRYVIGVGGLQFVLSALVIGAAVAAVGGGHERCDRARPLPRHVVDRHRDAAARGRGPHRDAGRPHRAFGAAVPGPHGGAGAVHRRRARPRRRQCRARARRRAAAGRRRGGGDHGGRPLPAAADLPAAPARPAAAS